MTTAKCHHSRPRKTISSIVDRVKPCHGRGPARLRSSHVSTAPNRTMYDNGSDLCVCLYVMYWPKEGLYLPMPNQSGLRSDILGCSYWSFCWRFSEIWNDRFFLPSLHLRSNDRGRGFFLTYQAIDLVFLHTTTTGCKLIIKISPKRTKTWGVPKCSAVPTHPATACSS
jgi:hypothetical protein